MAHYNKKSFVNALKLAGLRKGDIVFGHSNIGFFGIPEEGRDINTVFEIILDSLFEVIGSEGTLIVPTFTYSFPAGKEYHQQESKGIGGTFSEMVRLLPEAKRSLDPSISVAALGYFAEYFTENMPENSYGKNCFFERLLKSNATVCNMNFDAATTFLHYVEKLLNVPYRFDKTFQGKIISGDQEWQAKNTIYVRYLHDLTRPAFEPFDSLAKEKGLYNMESIGRGFVKVMKVKDQYELLKQAISDSPWFLTKAGVTRTYPNINEFTEALK